jgi:hypothetical protein
MKPTLADELIEIDQAFDVGEAHIAAYVVDLEIVLTGPAGAHRLNSEHQDILAA